VDALERLGLDYDRIKEKFPQLIYCRLTAYGAVGPDKNEPGYDVGAFWAATGMGASIQPEVGYIIISLVM
jgi:(R)-2-hydroxy-4-methylpentanoate CoA-transferase